MANQKPISQDEVVAWLASGAAFDGVAPDHICTHLSHLFLVGERVFKMKRDIILNFVDLSALVSREKSCADEVRLNQRTAPDLYLRAVSVTCHDGVLNLGEQGEVVEWLVEMRRFKQADLFDVMALKDRLTDAHLKTLTEQIITFHAGAQHRPDKGGAAYMCQNAENVRNNMKRFGAEFLPKADITAWHSAIHEIFESNGHLMDDRRTNGFVRQCHGDMHLGNICLYNGDPTLFDCIEFNDDLSCIDVLYDLAFLIMDLLYRGMPIEANMVLSRYLSATRDYAGLPLMSSFMSLRSAIRAMTSAIDAHEDVTTSADVRAEVVDHLTLALKLVQPVAPRLVAIGGLSGSGKSTLARAIAPNLSDATVVLSSDIIRKRLFEVSPETALPESAYTREQSARTYARLFEDAATALTAGQVVIADATFIHPQDRDKIEQIALDMGLPFEGLWLEIEPALMEKRLGARTRDTSDADAAVLSHQLAEDTGEIKWQKLSIAPSDLSQEALVRLISQYKSKREV